MPQGIVGDAAPAPQVVGYAPGTCVFGDPTMGGQCGTTGVVPDAGELFAGVPSVDDLAVG